MPGRFAGGTTVNSERPTSSVVVVDPASGDVKMRKEMRVVDGLHISGIKSLAFSPGGTILASAAFGSMALWVVPDLVKPAETIAPPTDPALLEEIKKFAEVTERLQALSSPQNQFGIVLDGLVIYAPSLASGVVISAGKAQISGSFTR